MWRLYDRDYNKYVLGNHSNQGEHGCVQSSFGEIRYSHAQSDHEIQMWSELHYKDVITKL